MSEAIDRMLAEAKKKARQTRKEREAESLMLLLRQIRERFAAYGMDVRVGRPDV